MSRAFAHIGPRAPFIGTLLVASTLAATWLLSGVAVGEASRFIAFEALYVLLPGCMLYVLLGPSRSGWLRVLAIGWPLGYALEMGAFALTAYIGARWAFSLLPAVAATVLGPLMYIRWRSSPGSFRRLLPARGARARVSGGGLEILLLALAISFALVLLSLKYFALYPLPWHTSSIVYAQDNISQISYAVEARYHWPVTLPYAAGEPWRYYIGVFVHFAAINQVTGVSLSTVVMRFFPATAILVIALQLWFVGSVMGRSRWVGPVAVVLFFAMEDLNLDPTRRVAFGNDLFGTIPLSPTSTFGLVFFLGLLALAQTSVVGDDGAGRFVRAGASRWLPARPAPLAAMGTVAMVGALVLGATAAAIYASIDFVGGLGLFWLWRCATAGLDRLLSGCLIVSAICLLAIQRLLLSGSDLGATRGIRVFSFLYETIFSSLLFKHSVLWFIPSLAAAVVVCICAWTSLLGAAFLWWRPGARSSNVVFSVAVFIISLGTYVFVKFLRTHSLIYLFWYGNIAMIPVAALGLTSTWSSISRVTRRKLGIACGMVLCAGLAMSASVGVLTAEGVLSGSAEGALSGSAAGALSGSERVSWEVWYAVAYGSIACLIVLMALRLQSHLAPVISSRTGRVVACCILMLCVLGFVKPIAWTAHRTGQAILGKHVGLRDSRMHAGLTSGLYEGLIWVRNHTSRCDVLAKNNLYKEDGTPIDEYDYAAAFTERRVYLEAWVGTARAEYGEQTFPARFALNTMATKYGSEAALRELGRLGVSYVLIDEIHGGGAMMPPSVTRRVFGNGALTVYRLLTPASSNRRCGAIV